MTTEEDDDTQVYKKPWAGLTDEDKWGIRKAVTHNQFETASQYARRVQAATEAKLKEKNA